MTRKTPLWTEENFSEEKQKITLAHAGGAPQAQDMNFALFASGVLNNAR